MYPLGGTNLERRAHYVGMSLYHYRAGQCILELLEKMRHDPRRFEDPIRYIGLGAQYLNLLKRHLILQKLNARRAERFVIWPI